MTPEFFIQQYEKALQSQQWEQVAPLIADFAQITFSTGKQLKGKTEISAAYRHNFSIIKNEKFLIENIEWIEKNEQWAVYTFSYQWQGIIGGATAGGKGIGMAVLKNENNRWILVAEQLGKDNS